MPTPPGTDTADEPSVPPLTERQKEEAEDRTSVSAVVVHEAIRLDGDEELNRPMSALAWSGLAAGLSMGFSFVGEGLIRVHLPDTPWRPLLTNLGYPLGFLIVVIGRQQLFTENTLTAIIPLLSSRKWSTFLAVMKLWAIVLAANLLGAHIFAWAAADTTFLRNDVQNTLLQLAKEALAVSFPTALWRGVFAGWLIAMMVWMNAASDASRIPIIFTLTYVVGLAGLTHIIAGSVEILYLVMVGACSWWTYLGGYMIPTLFGNIIGGVALVSALNHAQVVAGFNKLAPSSSPQKSRKTSR